MKSAAERAVLGRVSGIFGIKGWVKVWSFTDPVEGILDYPVWQLHLPGGWEEHEVRAGRRQGKGLIAQLAGCENRDQAQRFLQADVAVPRDALPLLGKDEYYWRDLEGLRVLSQSGAGSLVLLGEVDHLLATGANDVLVVRPVEGGVDRRERLIPWVQDRVVLKVDLAQHELLVDWNPDF